MTRRRPNGYERYLEALLVLDKPMIRAARQLLWHHRRLIRLRGLAPEDGLIMRAERQSYDIAYERLLEETDKYLNLFDEDLKDAGMSAMDIRRRRKSAAAVLREKD